LWSKVILHECITKQGNKTTCKCYVVNQLNQVIFFQIIQYSYKNGVPRWTWFLFLHTYVEDTCKWFFFFVLQY
jgi:hypothetical protein